MKPKNARCVLLNVVDPINDLREEFFSGTLKTKLLLVNARAPSIQYVVQVYGVTCISDSIMHQAGVTTDALKRTNADHPASARDLPKSDARPPTYHLQPCHGTPAKACRRHRYSPARASLL